jgi:putative metallohydrolase (TIGR04338 family)
MLSSTRASRMAKRPRYDTQRSKIYAAEAALPKGSGADDRLMTLAEVQAYVDRVTDLAWFRRRWGSRHITARTKRGGGGYAPVLAGGINIGLNVTGARGKPGTYKALVLHEIAHVVTVLPADQERNWHGPAFARTVLEMYGFEFGGEAEQAFRAACKECHVRIGSPTPLRAELPPARPVVYTWRVKLGDDELLILEGTSLSSVLAQLASPRYLARFKAADATELRIWKSRATAKAARP